MKDHKTERDRLAEALKLYLPEVKNEEQGDEFTHAWLEFEEKHGIDPEQVIKVAAKTQLAAMDAPHGRALSVFNDWCENRDPGDNEGLYAVRQEIRAGLARLSSAPAWMPIESAPKDSTQIVLHRMGVVWIGHYYDEGTENGDWFTGYDDELEQPTHWMPLPSAPQTHRG